MALQVDQLRGWREHHGPTRSPTSTSSSDVELTFAEWEAESNRLARGLVAPASRPGDRVALHLEADHLLRWIVSYAAHPQGRGGGGADQHPPHRLESSPTVLGHAEPTIVVTTSSALRPTLEPADGPVGPARCVEADGPRLGRAGSTPTTRR